jgi:LEA14-like dessication related protein
VSDNHILKAITIQPRSLANVDCACKMGNQSVWVTEIESVIKDGEFHETTEENKHKLKLFG